MRARALMGAVVASLLVAPAAHAEPWNMQVIHAPEAWTRTTGSAAVKVAVVDSGTTFAHPDLAPNLWRNPGEIGGGRETNGADDDGNGYVDDWRGWDFVQQDNEPIDTTGHGSHIAGVIAGRGGDGIGVTGVAWRTTVIPVRVLDNLNQGICADSAAGLAYAVRAGARIVNFSAGQSRPCTAEREVIERSPNTLFVVSAMNEGQDVEAHPWYPCALAAANVVCVAASDPRDRLEPTSNYGARSVDLAAPGHEIVSSVPLWDPLESLGTETFEAPLGGRWVVDGWQRSPFAPHGGTWGLTSTGGVARLSIDLTGRRDCAARAWIRRTIADPAALWIETSADGVNWERRPDRLSGNAGWQEHLFDLSMLEGHAGGGMRFRLTGGGASVDIDDIEIICVPPLLDGYTGAPDEFFPMTGTSHAAPHVAGVAALLLAQNPRMTAAQVKARILATVDRVPALAGKTVTGGRLNAARAVGAGATPPPRPPAKPAPALEISTRVRLRGRTVIVRGSSAAGRVTAVLTAAPRRANVAAPPGALAAVPRRANLAAPPGAIAAASRRILATGSRTVSAGRWTVRAKLTRAGRARVRRGGRLKAVLVVRLAPSSGGTVRREARVILRR